MRANQRYQKNDSQKEAKKSAHTWIFFAFDIITMLCVRTYIPVDMKIRTFSLCHMMTNLPFQLNCEQPLYVLQHSTFFYSVNFFSSNILLVTNNNNDFHPLITFQRSNFDEQLFLKTKPNTLLSSPSPPICSPLLPISARSRCTTPQALPHRCCCCSPASTSPWPPLPPWSPGRSPASMRPGTSSSKTSLGAGAV